VGGYERLDSLADPLLQLSNAVSRDIPLLGLLIDLLGGGGHHRVDHLVRGDVVRRGDLGQRLAGELVLQRGAVFVEQRGDGISFLAQEAAEATEAACAWRALAIRLLALGWQAGILARTSDGLLELVDADVQPVGERGQELGAWALLLLLLIGWGWGRLGLDGGNADGADPQDGNGASSYEKFSETKLLHQWLPFLLAGYSHSMSVQLLRRD
jgi:hypothetical protein